jgi:hypothetical protein
MTKHKNKVADESGAAPVATGRVNGKFAPGHSGNPTGRPSATPEEMNLLDRIKSLSDKAVKALECVLDDPDLPADAKIKAANIVFDRQLGKPRQEIAQNVTQHQATAQDYKPDLADIRPNPDAFERWIAGRDAAQANKSDHPESMEIPLSGELATGATN